MKKSCLFFIAVLIVTVMNVKGKDTSKNAEVTAEMLKSLPSKPHSIDWGFLPKTVATIDGKKVTKQELLLFFTEQVKLIPYPINLNTKQAKKLAPQLVDQLVSQRLLTDLASKAGFKPSKKSTAIQIRIQLKKLTAEQLSMLKEEMTKRNTTLDQLVKIHANNPIIQSQYAIGEWVKSQVKPAAPSDAAIKAFYQKNRNNVRINNLVPMKIVGDPPNSIRASHILITNTDNDQAAQEKIKKILLRLHKGESFQELAKSNSNCASAERGGALGAFKKSQMVKEFSAVAFELKVGKISGVVKTQFGYHIIRRDKSVKTTYFPYATVKKKISDYIIATTAKSNYYEFIRGELKKSKKEHKVKILVK